MTELSTFTIIPILGRKIDVPADDPSLFKEAGEGIAYTHDVGGINFDINRQRNACSKAYGYVQYSKSATAQATKCLGLFELYDGSNRNYCLWDNGKFYILDSALDFSDKTAGGVTHATGDTDLYCPIRVGSHVVWADMGENTPYSWKNGDANASELITAGTEFKFRYLAYFMRRIIGLYSDQTNGDIDIRWSGALPVPGSSCEFSAANQLWVPNDDSIVGVATMGGDRCYIYSENSIHQLVYYPDYQYPFRAYTVLPNQGSVNHHSIVNIGNTHYFFNKNYGFCKYDGGKGLVPISNDIEEDLQGINTEYYKSIVGTFVPLTRSIVWTVPMEGETVPNKLLVYSVDTGQWTYEDKSMRFIDNWMLYSDYTWEDLITDLGGAGAVWSDAGTRNWAYYTSARQKLIYANTDGYLYYHTGESLGGSDLDGYRIEPIMDFGDRERRDTLLEIWFDLVESGDFSIDVYHRSGSTTGEVNAASWAALDSVSHYSPDYPKINCNKHAKLHQIKWGTGAASEKWSVNGIKFKYNIEGAY
jgi:hypothetical protein